MPPTFSRNMLIKKDNHENLYAPVNILLHKIAKLGIKLYLFQL